jgi:pantothenate kinase
VRLERLVARHIEFGKAPDAARAWVQAVDQPNAERIARTAAAADLVVQP